MTGGDKGSKNSNDFERSGRDRNVAQGERSPENRGRTGVDNEKARPRGSRADTDLGTAKKVASVVNAKAKRERTTEAAVEAEPRKGTQSENTFGRTTSKPEPMPRKTTKRETGSRKPGTELTKAERPKR